MAMPTIPPTDSPLLPELESFNRLVEVVLDVDSLVVEVVWPVGGGVDVYDNAYSVGA
jgi:hypothetical protein